MGSKVKQKNIFESSFDSFEIDDGFLMKIDSDLKKNSVNVKQSNLSINNNNKETLNQGNKEKKISDLEANYYDIHLFNEDLDESEFFDLSKNPKNKNLSKVVNNCKDEKDNKVSNKSFTICLSPILGPKPLKSLNISSSTPLKPNDELPSEEKPATQKLENNSQFDYLEADLFDDWGVDETDKKNSQKDTVTFSQALQMIEEAESAKRSDLEGFNQSVDLLTGEVVGGMFEESFGLPKSVEKKSAKSAKSSLNASVEVENEFKVGCKPAAAQKLNFDSEKVNGFDFSSNKKFNFADVFNSDDDFDFLTQELLKKPKIISRNKKPKPKSPSSTKTITPLKFSDLNDSDEAIILRRRNRKCFNVIESDGTEDSPSPKFQRLNLTKKRTNLQKSGREFIDLEAEVSDEVVSSDEADEDGEYDKSFVDEDSYLSQNQSANMTAKYLESVKTVKRHGSFKIPAPKPYIPANIFSQVPEESGTDYEIDSFCVPNDVEEEIKTDLSDLEVAEKILEMDRKKRKKRRARKYK